jgi:hypothetical protein
MATSRASLTPASNSSSNFSFRASNFAFSALSDSLVRSALDVLAAAKKKKSATKANRNTKYQHKTYLLLVCACHHWKTRCSWLWRQVWRLCPREARHRRWRQLRDVLFDRH